MTAATTTAPAVPTDRRPIWASAAYLVWATVAGFVAVARNLPADFGGISTGLSATNDFLVGFGTALSPPVWWMAVQAIVTRSAARASRPGGAHTALAVFGATECIGALGEPITFQVFRPSTFDGPLALIQLGMIVVPLVAAVAALRARRAR